MKSSTRVPSQRHEQIAQAGGEPSGEHSTPLEPVRLLAGGGSRFEQRLLESARIDHMPATSRAHLASALNVPCASGPAELLRGLLRSSRFGKYGALVGAGACALLAAWAVRQLPAPALVEPARASQVLPAPPVEASPGLHLADGSSEAELEVATSVRAGDAPEDAASPPVTPPAKRAKPFVRARPAAASVPPAAAAARDGLREELRALEVIQGLVRAGRSSEARRGLDDYARRFPDGELRVEAELLGLDVSLARGELKQARERARELLARPGTAGYRQRLEAIAIAAGVRSEATSIGSESTEGPHGTAGGH